MPSFYEFFCGGGMARSALEPEWRCLFANDFELAKGAAYAANWGGERIAHRRCRALGASDLPGQR